MRKGRFAVAGRSVTGAILTVLRQPFDVGVYAWPIVVLASFQLPRLPADLAEDDRHRAAAFAAASASHYVPVPRQPIFDVLSMVPAHELLSRCLLLTSDAAD